MKKAGIAELKNRLSHYLQFVRRGQSVLVFDRDTPIARIDPVRAAPRPDAGDWTAELERTGALRPPVASLARDWRKHRPAIRADVVAALIEERSEGR
jgi:antitoxin (DNA-binding transcriptional repressor) of toxin-antitoxin stability system